MTPSDAPPSRKVRIESVGRRSGPAQERRSANGASTAAPIAKRMRLNPMGVV